MAQMGRPLKNYKNSTVRTSITLPYKVFEAYEDERINHKFSKLITKYLITLKDIDLED